MSIHDDKFEIAELLVRYATAIDQRDWPVFHTVFTTGCDLDYGAFGRWHSADEVTSSMKLAHERMGPTLHRISNIAIEVDGARATARAYVDALLLAPGGRGGRDIIGYYDDELVRGDNGWQIATRRFTGVQSRDLSEA